MTIVAIVFISLGSAACGCLTLICCAACVYNMNYYSPEDQDYERQVIQDYASTSRGYTHRSRGFLEKGLCGFHSSDSDNEPVDITQCIHGNYG